MTLVSSTDGKQTPDISVQVHIEGMPFKASSCGLHEYTTELRLIQNPTK